MEAAGGVIYRMDGSLLALSDYLDGRRIGEPLLAATRETYQQVLASLKEAS